MKSSRTRAVPKATTSVYDANGNMVFDGQKAFDYDDENQLTRITATNAWKSEFTYDGKMRRRIRKEYTWRNSAWALTNEVRYVYDGNLVIQERDANNLAQVTYTRGKDLSGALEGAGGIGGLLARTDNTQLTSGSGQAHAYYHADAGGNITMLINTQQVAVARYLYDSFGNTLSGIGPLADVNLYRFSSTEAHPSSTVNYYLYRFYYAPFQRWLNRDPIHEADGINLYQFVRNSPTTYIDVWGEGCGAAADAFSVGSDWIVPDKPGGFDFTKPCEKHDACYADCFNNKTRKQCDDEWRKNMYDYCSSLNNPIKKKPCRDWADLYYNTVRKHGDNAWAKARANCDCG